MRATDSSGMVTRCGRGEGEGREKRADVRSGRIKVVGEAWVKVMRV